ncbi:MAG: methyltransferase [Desulfovibrio sp.]
MEYTHSPKAIVVAGPPAAGKTTVADQLRDRHGYALISLDGINIAVAAKLGIEVRDVRRATQELVREYKERFIERLRALRYQNIVLEGCRISHPHIFEAFRSALRNAYGEYAILQGFYLNPDRERRMQQYVLRQAKLAKKAAKEGDAQALRMLKQEADKGFVEFLEPPLPEFAVVDSAEAVYEYAQAVADAAHPDLPAAHADLLKAVAESGTYNPFYQRIEVGGEVVVQGFTDSERSWDNILKLDVGFSGKRVLDIGCMHGYYSFKAEEAGASVTGVDIDEGAIRAAELVAVARNSGNSFRVFNVENPLDETFDVVLALNVLHRVGDFPLVCRNIFQAARSFVLEVGEVQLRELLLLGKEFGLRMKRVVKSHRNSPVVGQRVIVHLDKE